jgi:hypothetical protein
MKPHRGVLILVLGILSLVGCGILTGIPAWIMGSGDLKEIDAGAMDPAGRGMTQAGKILGMIAVILTILGVVVFVALMALGLLAGTAGHR